MRAKRMLVLGKIGGVALLALIFSATAAPAAGSAVESEIRPATGTARMVRVPRGADLVMRARAASPRAKADAFLRANGALFGIRDVTGELRVRGEQVDPTGGDRIDYTQVYDGIEVFGGALRAHFDSSQRLHRVGGVFVPVDRALRTDPSLDATFAEDVARTLVATQRARDPDAFEAESLGLRIFQVGLLYGRPGPLHLVYQVEVRDAPMRVREFMFIDAHGGKLVEQISGIHESIQRKVSEGSLGNVVWTEGDTDPIPSGWAGGTSTQTSDWQNEIDGARETYNVFGSLSGGAYLSYDGLDALMRTLNNDPEIDCPNATWNGVSANYCTGVTPDDIVGHEWAHGYTQYTNDLIYQWQSGALNEAYSDIWGEVVDFLNGRGTDSPNGLRASGGSVCSDFGAGSPSGDNTYRWLCGEDATAFGGAIRDMWRPECYGDPGRVGSGSYWCSTDDSGGVHSNSGVANHGFALLVDGGSYNGRSVGGIGLDKAARIYWRAQTEYTVAASDFHDHADALEAACADLVGTAPYQLVATGPSTWGATVSPITSIDCTQVTEMIAAVELRAAVPCSFGPLLDPAAPALCPGATVSDISSQDWESGLGGWTVGTREVANPSTFDTPDWAVVGSLPDGRVGAAAFVPDLIIGDCGSDIEAGVLYLQSPAIEIPASVSTPLLAFDHWVATESDWDGANVKVSVNGGSWSLLDGSAFDFNSYNGSLNSPGSGNDNPLAGESAFTGTDGGANAGSWGQSQVSLSSVAGGGDSVRLRFELGIDGCNGSVGWYVDDVRVYQCAALPTPSPSPSPTPVPTAAPTPGCGNGIVEAGEDCDDGAANGGSASCCATTCSFEPDGPASCDGNVCTGNDVCSAGVCTSGTCNTGVACSFCGGACSDASGACECVF